MQKKTCVLSLLAAACAVGAASTAHAGVLIYEPFSYTSGQNITGQANTTSAGPESWLLAGTSAALHVVGNASLSPSAGALTAGYPASAGNDADLKKSGASGNYDRLNLPNAFNTDLSAKYGAGSTLYYSLLLNVPSLTGLTIANSNGNANNDGLIAFNNLQGSQATVPNTWNGELSIRLGATAGTYDLGIRASTTPNAVATGQTYWTGDLTTGATHFIVVQATLGASPGTAANDTNSIWLDPSPSNYGLSEGSRPAPDGSSIGADSTTASSDSMQSLIIGAGNANAGTAPNDTFMDEIRVGNTWADVTPTPEPTTLALMGLVAPLVLRRRRQA